MYKILFSLITTIALTACSAHGPAFNEAQHLQAGQSGVYVYRTSQFLSSGGSVPTYIDGQAIGDLRNGGFLYKQLNPGMHTVKIEIRDNIISKEYTSQQIHIAPGQIQYLYVTPEIDSSKMTMLPSGLILPDKTWKMHSVSPAEGKAHLQQLKAS